MHLSSVCSLFIKASRIFITNARDRIEYMRLIPTQKHLKSSYIFADLVMRYGELWPLLPTRESHPGKLVSSGRPTLTLDTARCWRRCKNSDFRLLATACRHLLGLVHTPLIISLPYLSLALGFSSSQFFESKKEKEQYKKIYKAVSRRRTFKTPYINYASSQLAISLRGLSPRLQQRLHRSLCPRHSSPQFPRCNSAP